MVFHSAVVAVAHKDVTQVACVCVSPPSLSLHQGRFLETILKGALFSHGASVTVWDGILARNMSQVIGTINIMRKQRYKTTII